MRLSQAQAGELAARPGGMAGDEARAVLDLLMSGDVAPADGAAWLAAMAARGETAAELAAFVRGLIERAQRPPLSSACADVCGTGGSGLARFNVSTTVAFVLAAAGVPVAKHGNRGSARPNGSFDLLEKLGIPFPLPGEALARLLRDTGCCFLFARAVHPAVAAVAPMRKLAGRRTIFNLAGPLANPARPRCQVIGVTNERTAEVVAEALAELGVARAAVVWGHPGIDEFSVVGRSEVLLVEGGKRRRHAVDALHPRLRYEELPGGDAADNAIIFARLIAGDVTGALLDMVVLNAGAAIDVWHGRVPAADGPGVAQARQLIASGAVKRAFEKHRAQATALSASA